MFVKTGLPEHAGRDGLSPSAPVKKTMVMQYVFSKVHCNFNWLKQCFSADAWRSPIKVSPEALAVSWLIHLSVITVFMFSP